MADQIEKRYVFSDAAIQGVIDRALATLPKDSKGALVLYGEKKPDGTYSGAVAGKVGEHWSVVAAVSKAHDQDLGAAGAVIYSWK